MKIFYAYPASVADVRQVIHTAKSRLSTTHRELEIQLWEENDISGRPLTDPIFDGITAADILIADITAINFNVTFEIGYAIGLGKRIFLTRDSNITRDNSLADKIGIFDTLGFENYTDERNLSELLKTYHPDGGILLGKVLNLKSPVYVLQPPQSNWAMIAVTARIKKARLAYK